MITFVEDLIKPTKTKKAPLKELFFYGTQNY